MKGLAHKTRIRSKAIWLATAAMTLLTPVQDTGAQQPVQRPGVFTLRVTLVDAVALHEDVRRAARDEVHRILRPHDIRVETVDVERFGAGNGTHGDADGDIVKVLILPRDGVAWGVPSDAMGAAPTESGRVTSDTVYVFHPVILRALREDDARGRGPSRLEIGRALGRVIVHELVHALAPRQPHAERGIMADGLGPQALSGVRRALDDASATALRRGLGNRPGASLDDRYR